MVSHVFTLLGATVLLVTCSSKSSEEDTDYVLADTALDSVCSTQCDNATPAIPTLEDSGGAGNVTTYGSVGDPEPSVGGACNYGSTGIYYYAAAYVNLEPGDGLGLWNSGHICGQCLRVRVPGDSGWKSVVVRITDKCPDDYCGIDLGGAPAKALMGIQPGRYDGEWTFVSCTGQDSLSDGVPALHVKEGSNSWWSLVQVRNPPTATLSISWTSVSGGAGVFRYSTEAENFYRVADSVLADTGKVTLHILFSDSSSLELTVPGNILATADTDLVLE